MSQFTVIRRPITKAELMRVIDSDESLACVSETDDCIALSWSGGETEENFVLNQGEVEVTSPSSLVFAKMEQLAAALDAEVIGEEDKFICPPANPDGPDVRLGGSLWLGWPFMVIVLTILLIWRW